MAYAKRSSSEATYWVVFPCVGTVADVRRRLLSSFAGPSYEARSASVRSVGWMLSVGVGVLVVRAVRWVRGGAAARELRHCA